MEILADKLAGLAPGHDIYKVGLPVVPAAKVADNGDAETCDGDLRLRVAQFDVAGQTAHEDDVVEHPLSSLITQDAW